MSNHEHLVWKSYAWTLSAEVGVNDQDDNDYGISVWSAVD